MSTIVLRSTKGSALTFQEGDDNFNNLNTDKLELTDLSVTDSGGDGSLSYNNTTGVFTYTGPSASEVRAHFSGGTAISITDGVIAFTGTQASGAELENVVEDTTPQLGGNLDVNGNSIVSVSNGNVTIAPDGTGVLRVISDQIQIGPASGAADIAITTNTSTQNLVLDTNNGTDTGAISITAGANGDIEITPNGTGKSIVSNINYFETPYALSYAATITPDVANGTVQIVTLTGNVTFSAFSNPVAGQSLTLIVKQDATGSRTLTSTMKFAGAVSTLSTAANSIDIITVFYDGTNYYATLALAFE